ncbi:DUF3105 domain-containing protein [Oryzobacter sp. R7]|uniref:DUF3105 domain-containing protein n=1 Tax=Oryzobacter faecalis TaxID=3388656 RepID=UPI00398D65C1
MGKSTRPAGGARAGRDKLEALRKEQQAKERRTRLVLITSVLTVILLIAGIVGFTIWRDVSTRPTLDAVQTFEVSRDHTTDPVTYEQTPPVGGNHSPTWLNCGVYTAPVPNENAVHSLEHGAVWVTYRPDLPADQVEQLVDSLPDTYMVVSPFEGLDAPVVASAWGTQLKLTGVDDPRLEEFVKEYRQGPQTPEPGASCTGGTDGVTPGGQMEQPTPSDSASPTPSATASQ